MPKSWAVEASSGYRRVFLKKEKNVPLFAAKTHLGWLFSPSVAEFLSSNFRNISAIILYPLTQYNFLTGKIKRVSTKLYLLLSHVYL